MRSRTRSHLFLIALTAAIILALGLAGTRLIGQTHSSGSSTKSAVPAPKTSWGAPDLQGTWSNTTVDPFERPKQFGNREFMTDEEYTAERVQIG